MIDTETTLLEIIRELQLMNSGLISKNSLLEKEVADLKDYINQLLEDIQNQENEEIVYKSLSDPKIGDVEEFTKEENITYKKLRRK